MFEGVLQMGQGLPEKRFHHIAVTVLVGMGKTVSARGRSSTGSGQFGLVVGKAVTDVIQSDAMAKLCIKQADDMAPWGECPALALDFMLGGETFDQSCWNEFTNLLEYRHSMFGWFGFFHRKVSLVGNLLKPTIFLLLYSQACGMAVDSKQET